MIIYWIVKLLAFMVGVFIFWLPDVKSLPFGIDVALTTGVGYFNQFIVYFWPLQILWQITLWYVGFKVLLVVARFIFGARVPTL